MEEIGKILLTRRIEKKMKTREVAKALGVAESTYRDWENGRKIQGEPYLKISQVLEVPLGHLLGVKDEKVKTLLEEINLLEQNLRRLKESVLSLI